MLTPIEKIFFKNKPVGFLLRKSKHWYLPGFEGHSLFDVLQTFYNQIKTQSMRERASAISYNFIMAIPPSLLFLFTLIPHLPFISSTSIKTQLHTFILDIVPSPQYNQEIIRLVDSIIDGSKFGLLSFGLFLSLFFASNGIMGLMRSFNRKYAGFINRKSLRKRWLSIKITVILFGLLLAYLLMLVMQGQLLKLLVESPTLREWIRYTRWGFMILLVYYAIAFIYRYAPAVYKKWKFLSPGTIVATTLCILASAVFTLFIKNFAQLNALYGSLGTVMMVMALIYINSFALLIGFELNVSINTLSRQRREAEKPAM
ncbi:MAG TPA: YihY/virulence factor BrkB family protein [Ferruginibacter sp.]|nr:YihY/virulence factor BrkB family protein [Chitinophagaceae bacterium]HML58876.1 YihY/virulence factor BrkB family protein [Ferruginibacter sp.]HRN91140.1 YihY/virulence factor BrkB family protein [Ferruginibacter sp.]